MEKSKMGENATNNIEITFYAAECMEFGIVLDGNADQGMDLVVIF